MPNSHHAHQVKKDLVPIQILNDSMSLQHYGQDRVKFLHAAPLAVALPKTIEEVQHIVKYAITHQIKLTPSGGRTGLTGAATATQGELIVALDKMNKIINLNLLERLVTCEPGLILQTLHEFTSKHQLFYPIHLAAEGSCQIGGNIATNAGGVNVIRYGGTRQWVAGLKVVTGTGALLSLNNQGLIKNNTGYALHELFIGSEGTLGIIVEATLRLTRLPQQTRVLIMGHHAIEDVVQTFHYFQTKLDLLAFEMFDQAALENVVQHTACTYPLTTKTPFYSLIEFEQDSHDTEQTVLSLFETCLEKHIVQDGTLSQNETQYYNLWRYRENISESIASYMPYKYDISVPIDKICIFYKETCTLLKKHYPDFKSVWFGHIGDGNLHLNILSPHHGPPDHFYRQCNQLSPLFFSLLQQYHGSISAEHGIGLTKKDYLSFTRTHEEIDIMRSIKKLLDPHNIMNPGKIFDSP